MDGQGLTWDVTLPSPRSTMGYGARPRGVVRITTPERGEEMFSVPVAVARSLKASHDAGELRPATRAELLYVMGERAHLCASARVERLIERRDYSAKELGDKLATDGYSEGIRSAVVARAVEIGLVSDARYADVFIRSRLASGWGPARIEHELTRRGVDVSAVKGWPYDYLADEDEEERAYALARTRRLSARCPYEKLVRYLCGRGYALPLSCRVARRVVEEAALEA